MKQFIKNNLKVFFAVVISAVIFTGIGVYAASEYFAKDITFTPTNENFKKEDGEPINNVEDALNELYLNSNKELTLQLLSDSGANGIAHLGISDLKRNYKKFMVNKLETSQSVSNCVLAAWSAAKSQAVTLSLNNEYYVNSDTDGYKFTFVTAQSKTTSRCSYTIKFYN